MRDCKKDSNQLPFLSQDVQAYNWVLQLIQSIRNINFLDHAEVLRKLNAFVSLSRFWPRNVTTEKIQVLINLLEKNKFPATDNKWFDYALEKTRYFLGQAKLKFNHNDHNGRWKVDDFKAAIWLNQLNESFEQIQPFNVKTKKTIIGKLEEIYHLANKLPPSKTKPLTLYLRRKLIDSSKT